MSRSDDRCSAGSARQLAEELREYTAMKYAGNCKCGKCQLVPRALVERIYHTLNSSTFAPAQGSLLSQIEAEARRYAGMYPEASDGRNTFVLFANYVARLAAQPPAAPVETDVHPVLKHGDELHELGFNAGWNGAVETCAKIADLSGDQAATEKGRDMATGIAAAIRARIEPPPHSSAGTDLERAARVADVFCTDERKRVITEGYGALFPSAQIMELTAKQIAADIRKLAPTQPQSPPWQDITTAPSDGSKVWVFGGRYEPVGVTEADGDFWRYEASHGNTAVPTHWMPYQPPSPPLSRPQRGGE